MKLIMEEVKKGIPNDCLILASLCISLISILLSVLAFHGFPCISVAEFVLALIGVCTTFIVGVNIYNAIEVHREMREIREKSKIIDEIDIRTKRIINQFNILFHLTWGIHYMDKEYYKCQVLWEFVKALRISADINDFKHAKNVIMFAKEFFSKEENSKIEWNNDDLRDILNNISIVQESSIYSTFKEEIDELYRNISNSSKH